jgi:hypothetical protein
MKRCMAREHADAVLQQRLPALVGIERALRRPSLDDVELLWIIGSTMKETRDAVSDPGRRVRSKGELTPTTGAPQTQETIRCSISYL